MEGASPSRTSRVAAADAVVPRWEVRFLINSFGRESHEHSVCRHRSRQECFRRARRERCRCCRVVPTYRPRRRQTSLGGRSTSCPQGPLLPDGSEFFAIVGRHERMTAVAMANFLRGVGEGQVPKQTDLSLGKPPPAAMGRYAKLSIATPMHSSQLGVVAWPTRGLPRAARRPSIARTPLHNFERMARTDVAAGCETHVQIDAEASLFRTLVIPGMPRATRRQYTRCALDKPVKRRLPVSNRWPSGGAAEVTVCQTRTFIAPKNYV